MSSNCELTLFKFQQFLTFQNKKVGKSDDSYCSR